MEEVGLKNQADIYSAEEGCCPKGWLLFQMACISCFNQVAGQNLW